MAEFNIINRSINIPPEIESLVVQGDTNSTTITFNMPSRFADGVDLSGKTIQIAYKNALNQTAYGDAQLSTVDISSFKFTWTIESSVTSGSGSVSIWVEFSEKNLAQLKTYIWKTKPKTFSVEPSFYIYNDAVNLDYTAQQAFVANNVNTVMTTISDSNEPIYIQGRTILMLMLSDFIVSGDNRSQILSFSMDRYYENIDRSTLVISIPFVNADNKSDRTGVVNKIVTDTTVTFGWLVDSKVSFKEGTVKFKIELLGYDENNKFYCWQTKDAYFTVEKGLEVDSNIEQPDPSWYQSFKLDADNLFTGYEEQLDTILNQTDIRGTTQVTTWNTDGTIQKIEHKDTSTNEIIRADTFTYEGDIITEVRTMTSGGSLTFVYDVENYTTTII